MFEMCLCVWVELYSLENWKWAASFVSVNLSVLWIGRAHTHSTNLHVDWSLARIDEFAYDDKCIQHFLIHRMRRNETNSFHHIQIKMQTRLQIYHQHLRFDYVSSLLKGKKRKIEQENIDGLLFLANFEEILFRSQLQFFSCMNNLNIYFGKKKWRSPFGLMHTWHSLLMQF